MNEMLSVIMPIYNEMEISVGVERTIRVMENAGIPYELILVDDGSTNDSWNQMTDLASQYETITAIALSRNFGKEKALCAGLDEAPCTLLLALAYCFCCFFSSYWNRQST